MIIKVKKRAKFSGIIFIILLVVLIISIFFFVNSGFFRIKKIEVLGDKVECAEIDQIKNEAELYGQNFFFLDKTKPQEKLKAKFLCINEVYISKVFPDKLNIKIISRRPAAILINTAGVKAQLSLLIENIATPEASGTKGSFIVDNEGVVFSKSRDDLDILRIYVDMDLAEGKKFGNSFINNTLKILDRIKTFGLSFKKSWIIEDVLIINPDTSDPKIIFKLSNQTDIQLASLQLILAKAKIDLKELTFIDLRFDKPVVRFAPKKN